MNIRKLVEECIDEVMLEDQSSKLEINGFPNAVLSNSGDIIINQKPMIVVYSSNNPHAWILGMGETPEQAIENAKLNAQKMAPSLKYLKEEIKTILMEELGNKDDSIMGNMDDIPEGFDPQSNAGPNPSAIEGNSDENPYAAWNAEMRKLEEKELHYQKVDTDRARKSLIKKLKDLENNTPAGKNSPAYKRYSLALKHIDQIEENTNDSTVPDSGFSKEWKTKGQKVRIKFFNSQTGRNDVQIGTIKQPQTNQVIVRLDNGYKTIIVPWSEVSPVMTPRFGINEMGEHSRYAQEAGAGQFDPRTFGVNESDASGQIDKLSNNERNKIGIEFKRRGLDGNGRFEKKEQGLGAITDALSHLGFQLDMVTGDLIIGDKGSRNLSFRRVNDPDQDIFTEKPEIRNSRIVFTWELLDGPSHQYPDIQKKYEILAYAS